MLAGEALFAEADRQLSICNACRYCEGYCPVFPSLARLTSLDADAITKLANLCHDCRDCYHACMYVAPHEFDLNPPVVFAAVRRGTYARGAGRVGALLGAPAGVIATGLFMAGLLVVLCAAVAGVSTLVHASAGPSSPYRIVSDPALVALGLATAACGLGAMALGVRGYWRRLRPRPIGAGDLARVLRAFREALLLSHMRGGGAGCAYPDTGAPGPYRRIAHLAVANGFLACLVSTIAAAITQDIVGKAPPYSYVSVPVIFGLAGGLAMVAGTVALLVQHARADATTSEPGASRANLALIWALLVIAATGLATLFVRSTASYGVVLLVHLTAVFSCFVLAPYSSFVHGAYRTVALVIDRLEAAG